MRPRKFPIKEHEWLDVGAWVYDNFEWMSGVSFLPFDEHTYQQAPYQDCDKSRYDKVAKSLPIDIDWTKLKKYEAVDTTTSSQELACSGNSCELV